MPAELQLLWAIPLIRSMEQHDMYYNLAILVNRDDNETDHQLADKAEQMCLRFDRGLELPKYKRYLEDKEVREMSQFYKTEDRQELALKIAEWEGGVGGVDEDGLFVVATHNPNGKFDRGELIDLIPRNQWEEVFLSGKENLVCRAVITPDGTWYDHWDLIGEDFLDEDSLDKWERQVRTLLAEHTDATAFLATLHT